MCVKWDGREHGNEGYSIYCESLQNAPTKCARTGLGMFPLISGQIFQFFER